MRFYRIYKENCEEPLFWRTPRVQYWCLSLGLSMSTGVCLTLSGNVGRNCGSLDEEMLEKSLNKLLY